MKSVWTLSLHLAPVLFGYRSDLRQWQNKRIIKDMIKVIVYIDDKRLGYGLYAIGKTQMFK